MYSSAFSLVECSHGGGGHSVILFLRCLYDTVGTCPPPVTILGQENRVGTHKPFP